MVNNVFRKAVTFAIITLFIGASIIPSMAKIIIYKQQTITQNIDKALDEALNQFNIFIDKQKNLKINPSIKKFIKKAVTSNDDGKVFPGFYRFNPCDPINIKGIGIASKNESSVVVYLQEGTAHLNNSFNGEYLEWEIAALGTFINFSGVCNGSNEYPFKPINVNGSSEYALFIENSFMLKMSVKEDKYKRGVKIPIKIKNLKLRDLELVNPHFYMYRYNEETEELNLIYEKILQETWELPQLGTKTWEWDQKNENGDQVPDGNYSIIAEFEIDGILHPIFGPGVEIVEKLAKNNKNPQILYYRILEKLPLLNYIRII